MQAYACLTPSSAAEPALESPVDCRMGQEAEMIDARHDAPVFGRRAETTLRLATQGAVDRYRAVAVRCA